MQFSQLNSFISCSTQTNARRYNNAQQNTYICSLSTTINSITQLLLAVPVTNKSLLKWATRPIKAVFVSDNKTRTFPCPGKSAYQLNQTICLFIPNTVIRIFIHLDRSIFLLNLHPITGFPIGVESILIVVVTFVCDHFDRNCVGSIIVTSPFLF